MKIFFIRIFGFGFSLIFIFSDYSNGASIGELAPDFSLIQFSNTKHELSLKELRGKLILINFWATWCAPCKKELPGLDKLAKEYKEKNLVVLAINIDKDIENTKRFLNYYPVAMPVLIDSESSVVAKYKAMAMPTSFIIDKKGIIRFIHLGFTESDPKEWRKELDSLISSN